MIPCIFSGTLDITISLYLSFMVFATYGMAYWWLIFDIYGCFRKKYVFPNLLQPIAACKRPSMFSTYIIWVNSQLFPFAHFQTATGSQVKTRERWQHTGNSWEKNKFLEHQLLPTDGCENGSWEEDWLDVVPVNVIILESQVYVYVAASKFSEPKTENG